MKEAVIKIEIKVVVEREECGNDGFHTEEKSRDENGDKSLEIDLVKVAIIDLFAKNGLSFDEIEAVLYPDSSFEDVFGRRLDHFKPRYPAAFIADTFSEEFNGLFEEEFPNEDRDYYFIWAFF